MSGLDAVLWMMGTVAAVLGCILLYEVIRIRRDSKIEKLEREENR